MYVPHFNAVDDQDALRAFVGAAQVAQLITVDPAGTPVATLLPVLWAGDRLIAHMARANEHWQSIADDSTGLAVVSGPDTYLSPAWYPSKAEHGRVVPTWNYSAVHLTGTVTVHQDPEWLRTAVTALTEHHESVRAEPWQVTDAPDRYVTGQLRAIVGIELLVTRVEGKAKLSQNRPADDQAAVITGLRAERSDPGSLAVAAAMAESLVEQGWLTPGRPRSG